MNKCIEYHLALKAGKVTPQDRPRPAIDAWKEVGGWCSDAEGAELQRIAAGKRVLEIGTWNGRSAIAMAATADHVFAVDHFYGDAYAGYGNPGAKTWERIVLTESRERITLVTGYWRDVLPCLDLSRFDVIYYDADHTYEAASEFFGFVRGTKSLLALHDYDHNPNHAGTRRAVDESGFKIRVVDRLAVLGEL